MKNTDQTTFVLSLTLGEFALGLLNAKGSFMTMKNVSIYKNICAIICLPVDISVHECTCMSYKFNITSSHVNKKFT